MIEDGYFVQFFEDDEAKKQEPRNIVVIKNGKVSFYINPKENEVDKKYFCPLWKERYPQWMSFEMDDTIIKLIDKIQSFISEFSEVSKISTIPNINSCLINKYSTGENFIAPHRDSEVSFGLEPTIIGLSIGQTRTIDFNRLDKKSHFSFDLESRSIFIMSGSSQRFYHHSLKKTICENVRYSLTFRELIL